MKENRTPEETWRFQKAKLKLKFSHLDDDDFNYDYGMKDVMMNKLSAKLGRSREDLAILLVTL
jgi:hypothetical protein